jgi:hypothetical protein
MVSKLHYRKRKAACRQQQHTVPLSKGSSRSRSRLSVYTSSAQLHTVELGKCHVTQKVYVPVPLCVQAN